MTHPPPIYKASYTTLLALFHRNQKVYILDRCHGITYVNYFPNISFQNETICTVLIRQLNMRGTVHNLLVGKARFIW